MAATAALAHDSRHIAGDCRPNRAEGSARPGHRAKTRAASPTATAAGSARLPATKESALTLIGRRRRNDKARTTFRRRVHQTRNCAFYLCDDGRHLRHDRRCREDGPAANLRLSIGGRDAYAGAAPVAIFRIGLSNTQHFEKRCSADNENRRHRTANMARDRRQFTAPLFTIIPNCPFSLKRRGSG
jgi:hypothetical protein